MIRPTDNIKSFLCSVVGSQGHSTLKAYQHEDLAVIYGLYIGFHLLCCVLLCCVDLLVCYTFRFNSSHLKHFSLEVDMVACQDTTCFLLLSFKVLLVPGTHLGVLSACF